MCSCCGHRKKELSLSKREYHYEQCEREIDRNLNAALNLVAISLPETENACGEEVRLTLSGFRESTESSLDETGTEHHPGLDVQECLGFGERLGSSI
ncbi:MAG: zinc ribbon domain-containing protein [Candidatus Thorarchaeota archaeon]